MRQEPKQVPGKCNADENISQSLLRVGTAALKTGSQ
jgi:hypothetical protein